MEGLLMNYMQIDKASISNGLGFRVVLWCSGCSLQCKGCQNPQAQDFNAGKPFDDNAKALLFQQLSKPYIKGITISGGHPMERQNVNAVYDLITEIKSKFPSKDIWLYTGLTLTTNDFQQNGIAQNDIYRMCDVVVDGPFIEEQKNFDCPFRGSSNQRILYLKDGKNKQ